MTKKIIFAFIAVILFAVFAIAAGWGALQWYSEQSVLPTEATEFTIKEGDSFGVILYRLNKQQIIAYPELLKWYARLDGMANDMQAGEYLIPPNITILAMLNMFAAGEVRTFNITLIEGQTLQDTLEHLNKHPKLSAPIPLQELTSTFNNQFTISPVNDNAEGLFYADTYQFHANDSVASILQQAHKKLVAVLNEEWAVRGKNLPYKSPYEALIMASIIEKETGAPQERADIAGVFIRRLQKKMRLQTDPTVIYGQGDKYQGRITHNMLREKTPYNTYIIPALPPTPIANVSRAAIEAALHPKAGASLYFVAKGDGTHQFSDTLTEHNRAVKQYQKSRRKDYRSTVNPTAQQ